MRLGNREMCFTPASLRAVETETQGWIQFETGEYILDQEKRDQVAWGPVLGWGAGQCATSCGKWEVVLLLRARAQTHTHIHTHTAIHTVIACMNAYIYMHVTHTHTHTHTHTNKHTDISTKRQTD